MCFDPENEKKLSQKRLQLAGERFHHPYLNHGHLLLTVKVLYTSDIFFTNKEMKVMKGGEWNVQEIVERPSVYIFFANADDTTLDKLCYVQERAEDIKYLKEPTIINSFVINDALRFFYSRSS